MTAHLDAQQLDQVWDARVLGRPLSVPVEDPAELRLFELLADFNRPAPNPAFLRQLERALALGVPAEMISAPQARGVAPVPHSPQQAMRSKLRKPVRRSIPAYALAAVALLLILSIAVTALPQFRSESGRSIPAVSMWTDDGPPTSPGLGTTPVFSQVFPSDDLAKYSMDQWSWITLVRETAGPGARSAEGPGGVNTGDLPGISVISVDTGQLNARIEKVAVVYRQNGAVSESVTGPGEISLKAGDTLVLDAGTLSELWNPTDQHASYLAGGLYTRSGFPIGLSDDSKRSTPQGIGFPTSMFAESESISFILDQVSIEPGQTFAYTITQQSLFLATVMGEGLEQQKWANGNHVGAAHLLLPSPYSFHNDGAGYYTLTNTSDQPVEATFFQVSSASTSQPSSGTAPAASVETLFDRELTQSELTFYQYDHWRWVELARGWVEPGSAWISNESPPDSWPGLTVFRVEYGTFTVTPNGMATVSRAGERDWEDVMPSTEVLLKAGDTIVFAPGVIMSAENRTIEQAGYVTGGLYDRVHSRPRRNDPVACEVGGGISFPSSSLQDAPSVDVSIQKVTVAPGEAYAYTLAPDTLLLAYITANGLQKTAWVDGRPLGDSQRLLVSSYTLHQDDPGSYSLMNTGAETVEVYLFRVVPVPSARSSPVVTVMAKKPFRSTLDQPEAER